MRALALTIVFALLVGSTGGGRPRVERSDERSTIEAGVGVDVARSGDRRDAGSSSELRLPVVLVSVAPSLPDPPRALASQRTQRHEAVPSRVAVTTWSRGPPSA